MASRLCVALHVQANGDALSLHRDERSLQVTLTRATICLSVLLHSALQLHSSSENGSYKAAVDYRVAW